MQDHHEEIKLDICLYGQQSIKFLHPQFPKYIVSNNPMIKIMDWKVIDNMLHIDLLAHDIQGETGSVSIIYWHTCGLEIQH